MKKLQENDAKKRENDDNMRQIGVMQGLTVEAGNRDKSLKGYMHDQY